MALISSATIAGHLQSNATATDGSNLTKGLILCMFSSTSAFKTFPVDFSAALTPASGGAYYVRGGAGDPTDAPAVGRISSANVSALGPPQNQHWSNVLSQRILIYGFPIDGGYDWALVHPDATFSPFAVVGLCGEDAGTSTMVNEENVGVLAYEQVKADSMCAGQKPTASRTGLFGVFASLARLFRQGTAVVQPTPLLASMMVALPKSGATVTGAKSKFKLQDVQTLGIGWLNAPPTLINGTASGTNGNISGTYFLVRDTVTASGSPIFGTCVYLTASNNNGTPTTLISSKFNDSDCQSPPGGALKYLAQKTVAYSSTASLADFGQVGITKTGGAVFTATADVLDRSGFGSVILKSNVKPLSK
jgi:hypothetical protein